MTKTKGRRVKQGLGSRDVRNRIREEERSVRACEWGRGGWDGVQLSGLGVHPAADTTDRRRRVY